MKSNNIKAPVVSSRINLQTNNDTCDEEDSIPHVSSFETPANNSEASGVAQGSKKIADDTFAKFSQTAQQLFDNTLQKGLKVGVPPLPAEPLPLVEEIVTVLSEVENSKSGNLTNTQVVFIQKLADYNIPLDYCTDAQKVIVQDNLNFCKAILNHKEVLRANLAIELIRLTDCVRFLTVLHKLKPETDLTLSLLDGACNRFFPTFNKIDNIARILIAIIKNPENEKNNEYGINNDFREIISDLSKKLCPNDLMSPAQDNDSVLSQYEDYINLLVNEDINNFPNVLTNAQGAFFTEHHYLIVYLVSKGFLGNIIPRFDDKFQGTNKFNSTFAYNPSLVDWVDLTFGENIKFQECREKVFLCPSKNVIYDGCKFGTPDCDIIIYNPLASFCSYSFANVKFNNCNFYSISVHGQYCSNLTFKNCAGKVSVFASGYIRGLSVLNCDHTKFIIKTNNHADRVVLLNPESLATFMYILPRSHIDNLTISGGTNLISQIEEILDPKKDIEDNDLINIQLFAQIVNIFISNIEKTIVSKSRQEIEFLQTRLLKILQALSEPNVHHHTIYNLYLAHSNHNTREETFKDLYDKLSSAIKQLKKPPLYASDVTIVFEE